MRHFFKVGALFFLSTIYTQVSDRSSPISFLHHLSSELPLIKTHGIDAMLLDKDDLADYKEGQPYRFGYSFLYDINFFDYAACDILDNGDMFPKLL